MVRKHQRANAYLHYMLYTSVAANAILHQFLLRFFFNQNWTFQCLWGNLS